MNLFPRANILLPRAVPLDRWAVIACDQFTSDPCYWQKVRETAGDFPSAVHLILPEAELALADAQRLKAIHDRMNRYLEAGCFRELRSCYVYVERQLENGDIRRGLVGMADLEGYDFCPGSESPIRATEETVLDRLPMRIAIRARAPMELPHIQLLCEDESGSLLESVSRIRERLPRLYDLELMAEGGHISGWLVAGEDALSLEKRLAAFFGARRAYGAGILLAVGDGNHALAAAKCCYEAWKKAHPGADTMRYPGRFALAELENIYDPALCFHPIHRILTGVDGKALLEALDRKTGCRIPWIMGGETGSIALGEEPLPAGALQAFLDGWLSQNPGTIDYIHGEERLRRLAEQPGAVGFLLPPIEKSQLFPWVETRGVLPKKTFSLGHSREKRYYLEGRKLQ